MVKIIKYSGFWTRLIVKAQPRCLFVFGDNDNQRGQGGQAIIRGLPNAIGLPTKKYPSQAISAYYSDRELNDNTIKIKHSLATIKAELDSGNYDYLVIPENGFGTGLSKLQYYAPLTLNFLHHSLRQFLDEIEANSWKQFTFLA